MQRVVHDLGGVPGLHIVYEAFDESVEQKLFELAAGRPRQMPWKTTIERRYTSWFGPSRYPEDFWRLINAVRDVGLTSQPLVLPNSVTAVAYPLGSRIGVHYDAAAKLGDVLMGVTTGSDGNMYMTQDSKFGRGKVTFCVPRRSIYVMENEARYCWRHGLTAQGRSAGEPAWNATAERRSFIFRQTMTWSKHVLRHQLFYALGGTAGCTAEAESRLAKLVRLDKVPKKEN